MRTSAQKQPARSGSGRGYFVLAVIFTLAAGAAWFSINRENIREYIATHESRELERARIAELKQRIAQLNRQQQSLAYNGAESEKQVRERQDYKRPGENFVYLIDEEVETTRPASSLSSSARESVGVTANSGKTKAGSPAESAPRSSKPVGEIKSVYDSLPTSNQSR